MDQDRAEPLMTRQPQCLPAGLYYALREYVTEGWNWRCALDELSETGSPQALEGLADAILGRLTDQELAAGVTAGLGPWQEWAANRPRVSAALGERELRRKKVNAERRRQVTRVTRKPCPLVISPPESVAAGHSGRWRPACWGGGRIWYCLTWPRNCCRSDPASPYPALSGRC